MRKPNSNGWWAVCRPNEDPQLIKLENYQFHGDDGISDWIKLNFKTKIQLPPGQHSISVAPDTHSEDSEILCGICNKTTKLDKVKGGASTRAGNIAGVKRDFDRWSCLNLSQWHSDISDLYREITNTKSRSIKKIIQIDIDQILKSNNCPESPILSSNQGNK